MAMVIKGSLRSKQLRCTPTNSKTYNHRLGVARVRPQ